MIRITILCVGKVKEAFFRDAFAEYQKRLSKYAKVDVIEVPDERTKENPTEAERMQVLTAEGQRLLKHMDDRAYVYVLDIAGKEMDSVAFSDHIASRMNEGMSHLIFVIGGSLGLALDVKQRANLRLSFSPMTFPHQMMRVILMEQIYRGFRILSNEPYHK